MLALQDLNWAAIGVVSSIVSIITSAAITLAVVYLKMFIKGEVTTAKTEIMAQIEIKFPQKVVIDMQMSDHEKRLVRIETKMETIRIQKAHDDQS